MERFSLGLDGKVVLITGAGKNLGREMACQFAREGATAILVSRTRADLEETAGLIEEEGGRALVYAADVTDPEQVEGIAQAVRKQFGALDVLVNNAAQRAIKPFFEHTLEDWNRVVNSILTSAFICSRAFGVDMAARKSGRIINVSSRVGYRGHPGRSAYSTAKGGLIQFTRTLALELAEHGITVNAVAPGLIGATTAASPAAASGKAKEIPLGRLAAKEEVASLVLYLASPAAAYITGAVFPIDGGWSAK